MALLSSIQVFVALLRRIFTVSKLKSRPDEKECANSTVFWQFGPAWLCFCNLWSLPISSARHQHDVWVTAVTQSCSTAIFVEHNCSAETNSRLDSNVVVLLFAFVEINSSFVYHGGSMMYELHEPELWLVKQAGAFICSFFVLFGMLCTE